jgi:cell division protein ZapE
MATSRSRTPLERYRELLESGAIDPDPAQAAVIERLDRLAGALVARQDQPWYRSLGWRREPGPRGLYLWGGVGRGKTWMMDLFFENLPFEEKLRIHFHRFMARVHDALRERESSSDPLPAIARHWARECRVLCFDEFFVADIADAMLLGGLLEALFERGVTLVATSNVAPSELYRDGLQRARFLPAIEAIERHTEVVHVDGDTDHRLRMLEHSEIYHHPLGPAAESGLSAAFERMAKDSEMEPFLTVRGRTIPARRRGDGIIWFDFDTLCRGSTGTVDYIEIARAFNTVLLSGIEIMDEDDNDAARRFVHLVDELYDRNVKLLASAEAPVDALYAGRRLSFEFQRTRSRLTEMQSRVYLTKPHLP